MRRLLPVTVLVSLSLSACDQQPVAPEGGASRVNAGASTVRGPVVEMVNGGLMALPPQFAVPRTFSFTARRYADGTVDGHWERYGVVSGTIVCFTIVGNQARIGTFTSTQAYGGTILENNTYGGFYVEDNGNGVNTAPDQISLQYVSRPDVSFAQDFCDGNVALPPLIQDARGEVQIITP